MEAGRAKIRSRKGTKEFLQRKDGCYLPTTPEHTLHTMSAHPWPGQAGVSSGHPDCPGAALGLAVGGGWVPAPRRPRLSSWCPDGAPSQSPGPIAAAGWHPGHHEFL